MWRSTGLEAIHTGGSLGFMMATEAATPRTMLLRLCIMYVPQSAQLFLSKISLFSICFSVNNFGRKIAKLCFLVNCENQLFLMIFQWVFGFVFLFFFLLGLKHFLNELKSRPAARFPELIARAFVTTDKASNFLHSHCLPSSSAHLSMPEYERFYHSFAMHSLFPSNFRQPFDLDNISIIIITTSLSHLSFSVIQQKQELAKQGMDQQGSTAVICYVAPEEPFTGRPSTGPLILHTVQKSLFH
jgi:hypothetical protein